MRPVEPVAPIQYIVEGGHRLSGTIVPSGNKNAALPIIAAALLTEHPVTLENVPRIRDTETLVELIRSVGASAEWEARNTLKIHAREIRAADLDPAGRSAIGPLRRGGVATARWRRHRPAPARYAFPGLRTAGRYRHRDAPAGIPCLKAEGRRRLPRRAQCHRHRERTGRRGRRPWHDLSAQRRLRATCAGPRQLPGRARRQDRGRRYQHHRHPRAVDAWRHALRHPARPYRARLADRARRGDTLAVADRTGWRRASAFDPDGL